ncbi:hypothetical protein E2C01_036024 [Portunus trituberculatus]|uniref:Uncharacterized protein n=1 Tax=Portunus trituberculatus TaxID=210409 RepID=A0A5B7FBB5_PORTR|nr:hypothetical protein [Portunus trituberculatus]
MPPRRTLSTPPLCNHWPAPTAMHPRTRTPTARPRGRQCGVSPVPEGGRGTLVVGDGGEQQCSAFETADKYTFFPRLIFWS